MATWDYTPSLFEVEDFARNLNLPVPTGNRTIFDNWFLALHEIGHHAVKPRWYRDYARVIYWDKHKPGQRQDSPCAPLAPDLWLVHDPTPNEDCVRLWCLQVCEVMGWQNPILEDAERFGGSLFNPRQWYLSPRTRNHCQEWLQQFGIDVSSNRFVSQQNNVQLPYPNGTRLWQLLANHDAIYAHFCVDMSSDRYDPIHTQFLASLAARLCEKVAA